MPAFRQRMARVGVRAGLLAGASAAVLAISGIGAGSAMAAPSCEAANPAIKGQGSSLQRAAQEAWVPGYNGVCKGTPNVEAYTVSSSGTGLKAWGFAPGGPAFDNTWKYIGSDDGPTEAQINAARATANNANVVVVPVTSTAIGIVVDYPENCSLSENKISNEDLRHVMDGTITEWNGITGHTGTGCNVPIKRVVRKEGSGTTFQIKAYLNKIGTGELPCTVEGATKWEGLEKIGEGEKPNITWPECTGSLAVVRPAGTGGGEVVKTVVAANKATEGRIGYAALPDVEANKGANGVILKVENGESLGHPTYASPESETEAERAACKNTTYTVPAKGIRKAENTGLNVDWSEVFGGNPKAGGKNYPICTLTYDIAWQNYETATEKLEAAKRYAANTGLTVKDFLLRYVLEAGQSINKWYSPLPTVGGAGSSTDVLDAAQFAAEKIVK